MTPKFTATLSTGIGYFIVGITGISYMQQLLREPSEKLAAAAFTTIAVVGGLSALCFSLAGCLETKEEQIDPIYAGEKFLHSSILFAQTLAFKYGIEWILVLDFVKNNKWVSIIISIPSTILLLAVASYGTYFLLYGFESINNFLWKRYDKRMAAQSKK